MYDPESNADVEGVLSRVRRLVSEPGTGERLSPEAQLPKDAGGTVEKFVLTDAHRVDAGEGTGSAPPDLRAGEDVEDRAAPDDALGAVVLSEVRRALGTAADHHGTDAERLLDRITRAAEDTDAADDAVGQSGPLAILSGPAAAREPGTEGAAPAAGDTVAPGIDRAALRAIVAEMVREELQGALGERITRNVRKLVRKEIYRVLISQDID